MAINFSPFRSSIRRLRSRARGEWGGTTAHWWSRRSTRLSTSGGIASEPEVENGVQLPVQKAPDQLGVAVFPQEQAYLGIAPLHGLIDVHRLGMKRIPQDAQGERARVPLLGQLGGADAAAVAVQNGRGTPAGTPPPPG